MRSTGRIRAHHCSCPEPGNHGSLACAIFFRQRHFRIEISNALFCLVTHPLPIVADVVGKSMRTVPLTTCQLSLHSGIDRWASGKLWRYLDEGFVNQDSHG